MIFHPYGIDIILRECINFFYIPSSNPLTPNYVKWNIMKIFEDTITINCRKFLAGSKFYKMSIQYLILINT